MELEQALFNNLSSWFLHYLNEAKFNNCESIIMQVQKIASDANELAKKLQETLNEANV